MPDPIARTYLSLGAFYASDPARRGSRERDVGLFWRSRQRPSRSAPRGCATPASCTCSSTRSAGAAAAACTCSRRGMDEAELERRLAGWPDVCGREGSLEWLLARMQDLPPDGEPVPPGAALPPRPRRRAAPRPAGAAA